MTFDPETIKRVAAESRAEQGLPPTIQDPAAIARITAMLTEHRIN